jgi:glycosyltransferase involved in cell wall biosynthesis
MERLDIIVMDGMSEDRTKEIVEQYAEKHDNIRCVSNPGRTAPYALNIGIENAKGEVIVRMDAHSIYPNDYVEILVNELFRLEADNVGAAWNTLPGNDTDMALAIATAMAHKFGVGDADYRVSDGATKEVDTVPFGCYRRDVFDRIGNFDTDLTRNQDDEFNARLIESGGKIFLIGRVEIQYFARENLRKLMTMYYQYGLFKPLVNKKRKHPATLRQFAPPLFVLAWIATILWVFIGPVWPMLPLTALVLVYFIPAFYFGIRLAFKMHKPSFVFLIPLVFFSMHFSYGWGYLNGIINFSFSTSSTAKVQSNR